MDMETLSYNPAKHLPLIQAWFAKRNFPAPDPELLPPTGGVVYLAGKPVCAGFLFKTDTPCAVIAHLVSDPDIEKNDRSNALDYLIITLQWAARDLGFKMVVCSSNLPQVCKRFEKLQFEKMDENVTHFRRFLCQ